MHPPGGDPSLSSGLPARTLRTLPGKWWVIGGTGLEREQGNCPPSKAISFSSALVTSTVSPSFGLECDTLCSPLCSPSSGF